jgi:hypothetical protein
MKELALENDNESSKSRNILDVKNFN